MAKGSDTSTPTPTAEVSAEAALTLEELDIDFAGGGYYLSDEEKEAAIDAGTKYNIVGIDYDAENKFGARYILAIKALDDPEQNVRGWAFSAQNRQRAGKFDKLMEVQEAAGGRAIGPVKFIQIGQFRTVQSAADIPSDI